MNLLLLLSHSVMSNPLWPHGLQHSRLPCLALFPGVCSDSCPLSRWCHLTISSSVIPFSSCLQSFPTSGSFPMSQFFALGAQSIGTLASATVLPMNNQGWFPLRLTGLISLLSKGPSRVFSRTKRFMSKWQTNCGKDIALEMCSGDLIITANQHWFGQLPCE